MDSPTGLIGARPSDILRDRYRPGNPESVRQLSLRVRLAEEKASRYRSEKEVLKVDNEKLSKELEEAKNALVSLRKEHQLRIEELEKQIRDNKYQGSRTRVQELMSLFDLSSTEQKTCEPPLHLQEKVYSVDASVATEPEEPGCSTVGIAQTEVQVQPVISDFGDHRRIGSGSEERTRLEADNFFLETQLKLAKSKIDKYGLQEVQKKNLEKRLVVLSEIIDHLIAENEKLKDMAASKLNDGSGSTPTLRKVVDVTLEYQAKFDGKVAELELRTKQLEELTRIHDATLLSLEAIKYNCKLAEEKLVGCAELQQPEEHAAVLEELRQSLEENAHLKERLSKYEKDRPASDTTKIFHFRLNPLDVAHEEYREFEAHRKRKAEFSMLCDADDLNVTVRKKQRDGLLKQVSDLQFQLHKSEKEKERALKIQSDLVKQYRAIVIALSGWQIKMKDDGFAQIESVFNPGHFFVFKVENFGKSVSLLETDYATKWPNQIRDYLQGRDSVPAFLAAVTLILDERSQSTQCSVSFDVSD